jgi:ATP-dependent 26S proteasome regulatory subunit
MPRTESTDEKKYVVDTSINPQYFVFLNKFSKDEDLVFVARVVKDDGEEMKVEYFPQSTDQIQMMMWTNWQFDERVVIYQRLQFSKEKPDRSQYKGPKD